MDHYDDREEVEDVIVRYHADLFTAGELSALRNHQQLLWDEVSSWPREDIEAASTLGTPEEPGAYGKIMADFVAFRRTVCDRVLREHASKIRLNRCLKCERIVMTPTARQCKWCGHDWHLRLVRSPGQEGG